MAEFDYTGLAGSPRKKYLDAIADLENRAAAEVQKAMEAERERRRKDSIEIGKWAVTIGLSLLAIMVALFSAMAFQFANLMNQVNSFHIELRDVRDRITIIDTERRMEKTPLVHREAAKKRKLID